VISANQSNDGVQRNSSIGIIVMFEPTRTGRMSPRLAHFPGGGRANAKQATRFGQPSGLDFGHLVLGGKVEQATDALDMDQSYAPNFGH